MSDWVINADESFSHDETQNILWDSINVLSFEFGVQKLFSSSYTLVCCQLCVTIEIYCLELHDLIWIQIPGFECFLRIIDDEMPFQMGILVKLLSLQE